MTPISVDALLSRMQSLERASAGQLAPDDGAPTPAVGNAAPVDFSALLRDAVRQVNAAQNSAQAKAEAFQLGDRNVSIEDVMVTMQQASLSFQGLVAVRNKLLEAYRDISNMPV